MSAHLPNQVVAALSHADRQNIIDDAKRLIYHIGSIGDVIRFVGEIGFIDTTDLSSMTVSNLGTIANRLSEEVLTKLDALEQGMRHG